MPLGPGANHGVRAEFLLGRPRQEFLYSPIAESVGTAKVVRHTGTEGDSGTGDFGISTSGGSFRSSRTPREDYRASVRSSLCRLRSCAYRTRVPHSFLDRARKCA